MNEKQVEVVEAELLEALIDGFQRRLISLVPPRDLGRDEDLLPFDAALRDTLAHCLLVTVRLGGIDVPVAGLQRLQNGGLRVVVLIHPQAEQWDLMSAGQPNS